MITEKTILSATDLFLAKAQKINDVQTKGTSGTGATTKEHIYDCFKGERDPSGLDPKQGGAKLDAGKPCVWRGAIDYFPGAIRAVATVSTFGATKYSWNGWSTVPQGFERYSDAMVRHLIAESAEGPYDNDSGLLHAAHVAWGALARLEFLLREKELKVASRS